VVVVIVVVVIVILSIRPELTLHEGDHRIGLHLYFDMIE